MTREQSKLNTIKRMSAAKTGKEITRVMLEHFKKYAPKPRTLQESVIMFNQEVPIL